MFGFGKNRNEGKTNVHTPHHPVVEAKVTVEEQTEKESFDDSDEDKENEIDNDSIETYDGKNIMVMVLEDSEYHYYKELDELLGKGYQIISTVYLDSDYIVRAILRKPVVN